LQDETANPLPDYMIALIESSWNNKTLRTDMENVLSSMANEKDYYLNTLIQQNLQDTIPNYNYELYTDRGTYSDYFTIAEAYIEHNDFYASRAIMYDLTQSGHRLSQYEETEISDFEEYINIRENFYNDSTSIYRLDSTQIETLLNYVTHHTGRGIILAHNILCALYDICIDENVEMKKLRNAENRHNDHNSSIATFLNCYISPNPAETEFSVVGLPETEIKEIAVISLTGKTVQSQPKGGKVAIHSLAPATYIVRITDIQQKIYYLKLIKINH
jgi:hypothetical protein